MTIKDITNYLEKLAPLSYQASYDNAGLLVGYPQTEVTGILATLDCTEEIIHEAIARNCNLIVAHHPIIFKGLKRFNGLNYVERTVMLAIKNDIAIYATHTNLDSVKGGVNYMIAEKLGLLNPRILAPQKQILKKLVAFVPLENTQTVLDALYSAGAGQIGEYKNWQRERLTRDRLVPEADTGKEYSSKSSNIAPIITSRPTDRPTRALSPLAQEDRETRCVRLT